MQSKVEYAAKNFSHGGLRRVLRATLTMKNISPAAMRKSTNRRVFFMQSLRKSEREEAPLAAAAAASFLRKNAPEM